MERGIRKRQLETAGFARTLGSLIESANSRGTLRDVLEQFAEEAECSDLNMDLQENGARIETTVERVPGAKVLKLTISAV